MGEAISKLPNSTLWPADKKQIRNPLCFAGVRGPWRRRYSTPSVAQLRKLARNANRWLNTGTSLVIIQLNAFLVGYVSYPYFCPFLVFINGNDP